MVAATSLIFSRIQLKQATLTLKKIKLVAATMRACQVNVNVSRNPPLPSNFGEAVRQLATATADCWAGAALALRPVQANKDLLDSGEQGSYDRAAA